MDDWGTFSATALGASLNSAANMAATSASSRAQERTNNMNMAINAASLMQQDKWFHENQKYNAEEAEKAFNRSSGFEREMFNAENKYNSPVEMMKRFREAGVNPSAAFLSSLGVQSASAGTAQSPAASGSAPSVPSLTPMQSNADNIYRGYHAVSEIPSLVKMMSEAALSDSQRRKIDTLVNSELESLRKDITNKDLVNSYQQIQNSILATFGYKEASAKILQHVSDAYRCIQSGNTEGAKAALLQYQSETEKEIKRLKGAEADRAVIIANNTQRQIDTQIQNLQSDTKKNLAQSEEARASAKNLRALASNQEWLNNDEQRKLKVSEIQSNIDNLVANKKLSEEQGKEYKAKAASLNYETDYQKRHETLRELGQVADIAESATGSIANVAGAVTKVGKLSVDKKDSRTRQQNANTREERLKHEKSERVESNVEYRMGSDGKWHKIRGSKKFVNDKNHNR